MAKDVYGEIKAGNYLFTHMRNEDPIELDVELTTDVWACIKLKTLEFVDPDFADIRTPLELVEKQKGEKYVKRAVKQKKSKIENKPTYKDNSEKIQAELDKTENNAKEHVKKTKKKKEVLQVTKIEEITPEPESTISVEAPEEPKEDVEQIVAEFEEEQKDEEISEEVKQELEGIKKETELNAEEIIKEYEKKKENNGEVNGDN